jgi:very-short-patch-repair endonuclease/predicted transcriptional regulator of viral defense system
MRDIHALRQLSDAGARQLGLVTRADAERIGVGRGRLARLVDRGTLERVGPSVFRFVGSARSWHQDVLRAVLDGGPECLASHRTAAALHGFDGFEPGVIEVLVPMRVFHRRADVVVHHTRALPATDRATVGAIPVTSRVRTLIDLGAVAPADRVEEALDGAERDGAVRRAHVERRYAALRAPGRNGIGAMTQVLEARLALRNIPRSVLERRMLRLLQRARLPDPVVGHPVRLSSSQPYLLDFAYLDQRLGLEVDGHGTHAKRRERAADNTRMNALENAGWSIRRFTYEQVMHESVAVASTVRAALAGPSTPRL